jgi:valyl-tRNA synthetase
MKLSKVYEPNQFEEDIYDLWEKSGAFVPKKGNHTNSYIALMPPPNANGDLHIGHALDIALKDTIIRRQRMMGKRAHCFYREQIMPDLRLGLYLKNN